MIPVRKFSHWTLSEKNFQQKQGVMCGYCLGILAIQFKNNFTWSPKHHIMSNIKTALQASNMHTKTNEATTLSNTTSSQGNHSLLNLIESELTSIS